MFSSFPITLHGDVTEGVVDQGSSVNILYYSTLQKMQILECHLRLYHGDVVRLLGEKVKVRVKTILGIKPLIKTMDVQYLLIDYQTPYHMILGRPSLNAFKVVVSTLYLALKFPISKIKVGMVHAS